MKECCMKNIKLMTLAVATLALFTHEYAMSSGESAASASQERGGYWRKPLTEEQKTKILSNFAEQDRKIAVVVLEVMELAREVRREGRDSSAGRGGWRRSKSGDRQGNWKGRSTGN